jgi:capsular exopolysaccharide synthesis family protein
VARTEHAPPALSVSALPAVASAGALGGAVIDAELSEASPRNLRAYLRLVYKYRWVAITCLGLMLGLAVLLTVLTTRLYTATARLQLARQSPIQLQLQQNVLRVEEPDRNVNGTSSFIATQVAVLRSRDLGERVIRAHRLAEDAAFLDPGADRRGLFDVGRRVMSGLRPRGWDAAPRPDRLGERGRSTDVDPLLIARYMRWLTVRDVRGSDLVEVSFTTPSPTLSAFLAAAHTQAYIEANEEARRANDVTAKDFLGEQLLESRKRLEESEAALRRLAAAHPSVAVNAEERTAARRIGEVSSLLTRAEGIRLGFESRYEFLTREGSDALAYFLAEPGVQKLHLALLDLRAQRAALGQRLGPNHPQMLELGRHERELERQLGAEVGRATAGVRARHEAARLREDALREKLARLQDAAIEQNELAARYDLLKNDVETAHALHDSLLKQQVETAVNSQLVASTVRVIERPEVPRHPSRPSVPLNLVFGGFLGLVVAGAAVFLCDHFDNSVKSSEEVEGFLQLPTLATIPNFTLARRASVRAAAGRPASPAPGAGVPAADAVRPDVVVLSEPRSPAAEAYRSLRTAILFSTAGAPPKVIVFTSAGASEGKTVSSINLATSLAEAGARVLLLDVDLRRPSCHRTLGVPNERGLSSFLAGQAELESLVRVLDAHHISFVPAGPPPPNPAELVGSERMRGALADLRESYDFVILDSPPVLPVTDAVVLGREADGTVLVVKGHDTPRELVRRARDQLLLANVHLLGAVVNNVDFRWGDSYYFYSRYYGGYGPPEAADAEERS